jgi:hypothetical protein
MSEMEKAAADQYRQHAEDAERAAQGAQDDHAKKVYREIAQRWRQTAEQVDRQRAWTRRRKNAVN